MLHIWYTLSVSNECKVSSLRDWTSESFLPRDRESKRIPKEVKKRLSFSSPWKYLRMQVGTLGVHLPTASPCSTMHIGSTWLDKLYPVLHVIWHLLLSITPLEHSTLDVVLLSNAMLGQTVFEFGTSLSTINRKKNYEIATAKDVWNLSGMVQSYEYSRMMLGF